MSNDPSRYGDQPAVPSDRVTEPELLEHEHTARILGPASGLRLVREIRRYRALLLGLAGRLEGIQSARTVGKPARVCPLCGAMAGISDHSDCPWPELEAEVKAIRAEQTTA